MPLSEAQLLEIQADAMADDVPIDLVTMSEWSEASSVGGPSS